MSERKKWGEIKARVKPEVLERAAARTTEMAADISPAASAEGAEEILRDLVWDAKNRDAAPEQRLIADALSRLRPLLRSEGERELADQVTAISAWLYGHDEKQRVLDAAARALRGPAPQEEG